MFTSLALDGRPRLWLVDAFIGGSAALVAITVANAALPQADVRLARAPLRGAATAPAPASAPTPQPAYLIAFSDPVPGRAVISPFGLRKLPWEEGGRLHQGVDIAGAPGEAVRATADGVVVRSGRDGGYGQFVEVRHAEGLTSFYAHLGAIEGWVAPGVAVKAGAAVGRIGNSGVSTGPHLHFEIRDHKDRPLNPRYFMGRQFAQAEDLPLGTASRVPRGVRIAYVSHIPKSKRELMEARAEAKKAGLAGDGAADVARIGGRPRGRIDGHTSPMVAQLDERKALIAQIAATQKAEMTSASAAPAKITLPAPAVERPKASVGTAADAVVRMPVDEVNKPS